MRKIIVGTVLFALTIPVFHAQAQNIDSLWRPFTFLVGEWTGDGKGTPGQSSGAASFSFDLEKHVLVRRNHTLFPPMNGRPASAHEDLLTIYYEQGTGMRALYADNEGHVIHYAVRAAGDTIEFLGDKNPTVPRFRLLYIRTGDRSADVCFDMAMPNAPEAFGRYLSGGTRKK